LRVFEKIFYLFNRLIFRLDVINGTEDGQFIINKNVRHILRINILLLRIKSIKCENVSYIFTGF